ncbi:uncharacterized protein LOC111625341 isoform X2 [Centruroides sculpturatus]|uniref:uncharacterized protein LOC111625341 isoform X2 n=1 Tax=Centruroides sculpturatus TaxID=218467 RepID=UPI000C6D875F|nr:uncharacterized protein LOC111625341 isoform X2 [Centruroides sculpturatus]
MYVIQRNVVKDEEPKLSENGITDNTIEGIFHESEDTEESPIKNIPKASLSPAEITTIVNEGYTFRPLYRAFLKLEKYSLVSEIIYEEEEPDSADDLSESEYNIESDMISSEDDVSDNENTDEIFEEYNVERNVLITPQHELCVCESLPISSQLTGSQIEQCNSNLMTKMDEMSTVCNELAVTECKEYVDEFSTFNESRKILEEEMLQLLSETSQEILENDFKEIQLNKSEFELNRNVSRLDENVCDDAIGLKGFKEGRKLFECLRIFTS